MYFELNYLFLFCFVVSLCQVYSLKLEKVFILGRHNLRAPLSDKLQKATPHPMPKWNTEVAYLTPKGVLLETYMGKYFKDWLSKEDLFNDECPDTDSVLIYTNNCQRTRETGRAFIRGAFENCNISVSFINSTKVDPHFNPKVRNSTQAFKEAYTKIMQDKLNNLNLDVAFTELGRILDIKNSKMCKTEGLCDLNKSKDDILFEVDKEPDLNGPLSISNSLVDVFLMSYYSDRISEDIAWGKIQNDEQWNTLLQITKQNQNVRFNSTLAADFVRPILECLRDAMVKKNDGRKFTMLVGHDSNLNAVMAALEFKNFILPGQLELTPIGGKILFQKWRDDSGVYYLKIEFVYQTRKQLKSAVKLNLESPPSSVIMEIKDCMIDKNGFCPWSDFEKVMQSKELPITNI